jgi:hypothetical protein
MRAVVNKNVELCEGFNIVNIDLSYFGLNLELQSPKVRYIEN